MCEGHHGGGGPQSCGCGGHSQQGCGCGGHSQQGCGCGGHSQADCGCGGHSQADCGCGGHSQADCGCGHSFRFHRWFSTSEEKVTALEQYLKDLEAEAKGVQERLAQLRGS